MTPPIGTLQWAQQTGGKLNRRERWQHIGALALAQIQNIIRRRSLPAALLARTDFDKLTIPDSAIALSAQEACRALSDSPLFFHCMRVYFWGAILAQQARIAYDAELFFVAAALHDLGLTAAHDQQDSTAACYAIEGARAAAKFATEKGWSTEKTDRLHEAIALHLNVKVELEKGAEAHLLHAGAGLDVIGLRYGEIAPELMTLVVERFPRAGFKREIDGLLRSQAHHRPFSRIGLLYDMAQFGTRIHRAPFSE